MHLKFGLLGPFGLKQRAAHLNLDSWAHLGSNRGLRISRLSHKGASKQATSILFQDCHPRSVKTKHGAVTSRLLGTFTVHPNTQRPHQTREPEHDLWPMVAAASQAKACHLWLFSGKTAPNVATPNLVPVSGTAYLGCSLISDS